MNTRIWFMLFTGISISMLSSCSNDDADEPALPDIQEPTNTITATPTDLVVLDDCAGFKISFTDNVSYFYSVLLTEEVAKTTSEEALKTYLSDKNLTTRRLPQDVIWSANDLFPEHTYILYTRAFDENDVAGEIIATEISTPSYERQPIVSVSNGTFTDDGKWYWSLEPNDYTACYYCNVYVQTVVGFYKGQIAWQFYHDILENPGKYRHTGDIDYSPDNYYLDPPCVVAVWGQTLDGKLSGVMTTNCSWE